MGLNDGENTQETATLCTAQEVIAGSLFELLSFHTRVAVQAIWNKLKTLDIKCPSIAQCGETEVRGPNSQKLYWVKLGHNFLNKYMPKFHSSLSKAFENLAPDILPDIRIIWPSLAPDKQIISTTNNYKFIY